MTWWKIKYWFAFLIPFRIHLRDNSKNLRVIQEVPSLFFIRHIQVSNTFMLVLFLQYIQIKLFLPIHNANTLVWAPIFSCLDYGFDTLTRLLLLPAYKLFPLSILKANKLNYFNKTMSPLEFLTVFHISGRSLQHGTAERQRPQNSKKSLILQVKNWEKAGCTTDKFYRHTYPIPTKHQRENRIPSFSPGVSVG